MTKNGVKDLTISPLSLGLFGSSSSSYSPSALDLSSLYPADTSSYVAKKPKTIANYTPWDSAAPKTETGKLASAALNDTRLIQTNLGHGVGSADKDTNDRKLFIVYNAMDKIRALTEIASTKSLSDTERTKIQTRIQKGLEEVKAYVAANPLTGASMIAGKKYTSLVSDAWGTSTTGKTYTTDPLVTGDSTTVVPQWVGNVKFSIKAKDILGTEKSVDVDLSEMGSTPRTVENVSFFLNGKMAAAGINSRFSAVESTKKSTVKGIEDTKQQSLKLAIDDGETINFGASAGDTQSAIWVAGAKTKDKVEQSIINRLDLDGTAISNVSKTDFAATNGSAKIRAMTKDADGNLYLIADSSGEIANFNPKAATDVVLQKIDSAGNVVFSRSLGSASAAQGFSIAVNDNDGTIAIAGAVNGKLDNSVASTGTGLESFVAAFDENGKDLWQHQQGAAGDDSAIDVKFAQDGTLMVLGKTTNAIGSSTALGGTDTYVQALDTSGNEIYTKSLGTSGNDTPVSLQISGTQAYVAWNDDTNNGHLSRLNTSDGSIGGADILSSSIGLGRFSQFAIDNSGNAVFVGEKNTNDAMYDQLKSVKLSNMSVNFSKDFSGAPVNSLSLSNGRIDLAFEGVTDENAADKLALQTKLKGISSTDGSDIYSVDVQAEADSKVMIAGIDNQSKSLESMGLPQGEMLFGESQSLTDVTGLHAGDFFYIAANGGSKRKITIDKGETMTTLTTKISNQLSRFANVSTLLKNGSKYLSIMPKDKYKLELSAGDGVLDALKQLGMDAGVAQSFSAVSTDAKTGVKSNVIIALDLPTNIDVSDKTKAKTALDSINAVLTRIRSGYRDVSTNETQVALRKQSAASTSAKGKASSGSSAAVAAYQAQTANMQAALARLGG